MAAVYGVEAKPQTGDELHFEGRFSGALPNDLGGAGSFTRYSSPLGKSFVYVERLRGDDNPLKRLEERLQAVDVWVDHTVAWSEKAFGGDASYPKLRRFLHEDLRRDIKNLGLHGLKDGVLDQNLNEKSLTSFLFLVGLFLAERGYFKVADLPRIVRVLEEDDERAVSRLVIDLLARRAGMDRADLALLEQPDELNASIEAYLRGAPEYKQLVVDWTAKKRTDPHLPKPDPGDVLGSATETLMAAFPIFMQKDPVNVSIAVPDKPLVTNGDWDGERIRWEHSIERSGTNTVSTPAVFHAAWCKPNEILQKRHFGDAVLTGESLFQFCLRYEAFTDDERRRFREGLAKLPPVDEMKRRFAEIREKHTTLDNDGAPKFDEALFSKAAFAEFISLMPTTPFHQD